MGAKVNHNYYYSRNVDFEVIRRTMENIVPNELDKNVSKSFYCVNYNALQKIEKEHLKGIHLLAKSGKLDFYETGVYKMFDAYIYQLKEELDKRKNICRQYNVKEVSKLHTKVPGFMRNNTMDCRVYILYGLDSYFISNSSKEYLKRIEELLTILKDCNKLGIYLILVGELDQLKDKVNRSML